MSDMVNKAVVWNVSVDQVYRGKGTSPISGTVFVAYGDTPEEARQRVDIQLLRECEERGITIMGRFDTVADAERAIDEEVQS